MLETIVEIIGRFFGEIIFQGLILGLFRGIKLIGIFVLKVFTFSNKSIEELKVKYDSSSKPYFIGFGLVFGLIYLIFK